MIFGAYIVVVVLLCLGFYVLCAFALLLYFVCFICLFVKLVVVLMMFGRPFVLVVIVYGFSLSL